MRQLMKLGLGLALAAGMVLPALAQTATPAPSTSALNGTTIRVGETVTGALTRAQPAITYTLRAEAGQSINITLSSDAFDAYLTLLDANGNTLAENDDSNGTNAGIQGFLLPQASGYQIRAESYGSHDGSGAEQGAFTLAVTEQHISRIEYTQTINDQLTTADPSKDYLFTGQAGDVVVISESSSDFNSYLHLLDSTGTELTSNDNSGSSLDAQIGPYTLTNTGTFTIRATSIDGSTPGAFTLKLNKAQVTPLDYNQSVTVAFTPNISTQYFTFEAAIGDLVTVSVDSGDSIDTSLSLLDSNNSQIVYDEDGGAGFDPEIYQQLLTSSGIYTIALQAVAPGTGSVRIVVKRTTPPSLDEGKQTVSFTNSQTAHALSFSGQANHTYTLTLHGLSSTSGSPSITITQDTQTLASVSSSTIQDVTFSFVVPADGQVILQLNEYSYANLSYEVSLTK